MITFAARLLRWFDAHGRHDLPWQHPRSAYRVWVSEIMLQQTQVATVIGYFDRFIAAFPDLHTLAAAPLDAVLAHWAGLGYYSRARNLHRAAQLCMQNHAGDLPRNMDGLCALPGIGRSTAAAILSQAYALRVAILDGNVKRVLARHAGIAGYPGQPAIERRLWQEAEQRLPDDDASSMPDYTQALMDLGASVCARRKPHCDACPVRVDCIAFNQGRTDELPTRKPRRTLPEKSVRMLIATDPEGRVLLQRRAPLGIWGGLWSLPELSAMTAFDPATTVIADVDTVKPAGLEISALRALPALQHRFTHFLLHIHAYRADAIVAGKRAAETDGHAWVALPDLHRHGIPTPIKTLIDTHLRLSR